jgi:hypothetical protein
VALEIRRQGRDEALHLFMTGFQIRTPAHLPNIAQIILSFKVLTGPST